MSFQNKKLILFLLLVPFGMSAFGQGDTSKTIMSDEKIINENYEKALSEIHEMLEAKKELSFKRAVFITENTYFDNELNYELFCASISKMVNICTAWNKLHHLKNYSAKDSISYSKNGSIFRLMSDTIIVRYATENRLHIPFEYDFDDFFGKKHWGNTFVHKLILTNKGTCHSLPYLDKIIADEMGAKCWLSLAPQHIYIKNYSKQLGWYNTELTSKEFPTDGWVMASGYITLEAIQNGIFMDTIGTKQAVALCIVDLANGYNRKLKNNSGAFVLKCCDLSLKYFPTNINALLIKAETLKDIYLKNKENDVGKRSYQEMLDLYMKIHKLGYREMPESMYMEWMKSLQTQKDKFVNKKISDTFKNNKK